MKTNFNIEYLILLTTLLLLTSCATHKMTRSSRLKPTKLDPGAYYVVPLDPTIKQNLIWTDSSGDFHALSEVSPDAVITAVTNLTTKLTADLKSGDKFSADQITQISQSATELGKRTVAVSILRDALYRLQEYNMNPSLKDKINIDSTGTYKLFDKILDIAKEIATAEIKAEDTKVKIAESKQKEAEAKTEQIKINSETVTANNSDLANLIGVNDKIKVASVWEVKGFNLLLSKDISGAIESFNNAYEAFPTYHNVFEIKKLLENNKDELTKNNNYLKTYSKILEQYSWGMSVETKAKFKDLIATLNK